MHNELTRGLIDSHRRATQTRGSRPCLRMYSIPDLSVLAGHKSWAFQRQSSRLLFHAVLAATFPSRGPILGACEISPLPANLSVPREILYDKSDFVDDFRVPRVDAT